MPIYDRERGDKFITTESLGAESVEQRVWDTLKNAFADRHCLGYWRYPLFSKVGEVRKEPDILIVDREWGLVAIEVRAIAIEQIAGIDEQQWHLQGVATTEANPQQRAEQQLQALLGQCDRESALWRKVSGRAIVALPLITREQWQQRGFDQSPTLLFQDQLHQENLLTEIQQHDPSVVGEDLSDEQWTLLLRVISGTAVLRKPPRPLLSPDGRTRANILATLQEQLYEFDLQQECIGKEIPPGFQRLRGVAGSGKTVLLCQKAAHMHLKHPDWDIALVFFTRTLYDPITGLLDRWLRRFSNGDVGYDPQTNPKLRVLHAWGGKERPGLYGTICQANDIRPRTVGETQHKQPIRGLVELCKRLSEEVKIEPIFDAILIDEGQDFVADDDLKFQDKQAIFWMAYQALRVVDLDQPEQRRLIWAYDEAQSLDTLKIPTTKELFGEQLGTLLSQGNQYPGGIKKFEVMRRCYRTPGSVLTAAYAMGMGLFRPEGMLAGITNARDWSSLGYEVAGDFRRVGQPITLHRPPENSPNPLPNLWGAPVLEFETYDSRQEELSALAENIRHNLVHDDLKPSRDILVVVLGSPSEAMELENQVAKFLMEQEIDIYIPTALQLNELKPQWSNQNPDRFWMEGGVTVSRVPRAKGNEADMVYVVGLDQVARNEANVNLRNQLFVALTRTRGWVSLSGVGNYPLYREMQQVMQSGETLTFTFKRPLKRNISELE